MAMNSVPLEEEGVCTIAARLAEENLKEFHDGVLEPTRWNGIYNEDGTTTGKCRNTHIIPHPRHVYVVYGVSMHAQVNECIL